MFQNLNSARMHAASQVFVSDNVARVGMGRWEDGRWELCSPEKEEEGGEEKEEEEAQEEAPEVGGEGRWMLWETQGVGGDGRWKDSSIKRYKMGREEEEGGGTSTKDAHEEEEEDEEEGAASSSGGGGTASAGGTASSCSKRGLQQIGRRRAPPLPPQPQPQQQRRTPRPRGSVAPHLPPPNPQPQPVGQIAGFYPNGDAPDISALGGPFNYPKPRIPEHWIEQPKLKRKPRQPRAQQQGELEEGADWGQEDEEEEVEAEEEEGVEEEGAN